MTPTTERLGLPVLGRIVRDDLRHVSAEDLEALRDEAGYELADAESTLLAQTHGCPVDDAQVHGASKKARHLPRVLALIESELADEARRDRLFVEVAERRLPDEVGAIWAQVDEIEAAL